MAYLRDINFMDKKELIGFILNDIKELGLIVEGMYEMDKIPKVMRELAISKTRNILDRFCQLEETPQREEIFSDILTIKENLFISDEKPEVIQETIQEEGKNAVIPVQVESIGEKMVLQSQLLFAEEEAEEMAEEKIPEEVDQSPSKEEKGTIIVEEEKKVQERTTNEKFKFRVSSVNPVGTTGKRVESRFVQNLRKAINLNDRYRYQKELFGGSVELMNRTIDKLDAMQSMEEAKAYVQEEFTWDAESGTVADFYLLLESRFS